MNFLLSDEESISQSDYDERLLLFNHFKQMPNEFFSKLRHFQPQVGCLNACSICSKYASANMSYWNTQRIRNVISALKYSSPHQEKPLIVWDRDNHRSGVIFSYLDNDPGTYSYLDVFINLAYKELGVKTRISTVGFSRGNKQLSNVHKSINKNLDAIGGVRLSFTPYSIGWSCQNNKFNREEYIKDMANFLNIYKPYYKYSGSGSRKFCVELRYKPLVINSKVIIFSYQNKLVIYTDKLLFVSCSSNISFQETNILDPYVHRLKLTNNGVKFYKISLKKNLRSEEEIINYLLSDYEVEKTVDIYKTINKDGEYYSIDPIMNNDGVNGYYIYPKTKSRKFDGYIINERFFLNILLKYEKENNINQENLELVSWKDVDNILSLLNSKKDNFLYNDDNIRASYLENEIIPMIKAYIDALKLSYYEPRVFFDKNFTIDTGIICNLGRAIHEFKGLVSIENEPLTLNHERNYGNINSTMTKEGIAWRLSCDFLNKVIIEQLDLSSTATISGQQKKLFTIQLQELDEYIGFKLLKNEVYIPGQVINYDN